MRVVSEPPPPARRRARVRLGGVATAALAALVLGVAGCSADKTDPATSAATSALPPAASSPQEVYVVAEVIDADTIAVTTPDGRTETVRLIGINAPETGECYSAEGTDYLTRLLLGQTVRLEVDVSDRDRYGRLLRYVWLEDRLVNEALVRDGYALARRYRPDVARADQLDAAEVAARNAGIGLWAPDACGTPSSATLAIVDLVHDAPGDDSMNLNGEWVVIANQGTEDVELTGWVLKDESATHRYPFPAGFTLSPGAQVTVYSGCGTDSPTELYWCETGSAIWNNDGDTAFLLDPNGNVATQASTTPSPLPTARSMGTRGSGRGGLAEGVEKGDAVVG